MATTSTERMRRMREGRRHSIEAAPDAPLKDADDLLFPHVLQTLEALELEGKDQAAGQLALRYALVIDQAKDPAWGLRWIGPELLRCLESLGATPAARAKAAKPAKLPQGFAPSRLDQLRSVHARAPKGHAG